MPDQKNINSQTDPKATEKLTQLWPGQSDVTSEIQWDYCLQIGFHVRQISTFLYQNYVEYCLQIGFHVRQISTFLYQNYVEDLN